MLSFNILHIAGVAEPVQLIRFWPDKFQRSSNQYSKTLRTRHSCVKECNKHVLTAHLLAESCFLTVQLKFFRTTCETDSCYAAHILGAVPLLSCFRRPCNVTQTPKTVSQVCVPKSPCTLMLIKIKQE